MGRSKPACLVCADASHVKTLGGGTAPRYRYKCLACGETWQQVPPHRVPPGGDALVVTKLDQRRLRVYLCPLCQQPKRKHVCTGFRE